jgi:hypothetical protein
MKQPCSFRSVEAIHCRYEVQELGSLSIACSKAMAGHLVLDV